MSDNESNEKRVFISYSQADKMAATEISSRLRDSELKVWFDEWEIGPGKNITESIRFGAKSSDIILLLVSDASKSSSWFQDEINSSLMSRAKDRRVIIIPILLDEGLVPSNLSDFRFLDLSKDFSAGVKELASEIDALTSIDYSRLTPLDFEHLVADLMTSVGFTVEKQALSDFGYDFTASFHGIDPFGKPYREVWAVEAKLYKSGRISISLLRELAGVLSLSNKIHKCLIVTTGVLTSVARDALKEINLKTHGSLRVIDSDELTSLLRERSSLVSKYFGADTE